MTLGLDFDLEYDARVARLTLVILGLQFKTNSRNTAVAVLSNPINIQGTFYAIDDSDLIDVPFEDIRKVVNNKMLYTEPKKERKYQRKWEKELNDGENE